MSSLFHAGCKSSYKIEPPEIGPPPVVRYDVDVAWTDGGRMSPMLEYVMYVMCARVYFQNGRWLAASSDAWDLRRKQDRPSYSCDLHPPTHVVRVHRINFITTSIAALNEREVRGRRPVDAKVGQPARSTVRLARQICRIFSALLPNPPTCFRSVSS